MKRRIVEGDVAQHQPDENQRAAGTRQGEGALHRPAVTRGVEDRARGFASLRGPLLLDRPLRVQRDRLERGVQARRGGAAGGVDIHPHHAGPGQQRELHRGQADGPQPDDRHGVARRKAADGQRPVHRVLSDAQRLDQGQLIQGERRRDMQFCRRHHDLLAHAAVAVNAHTGQRFAAVRAAAGARRAGAAVQVRLDRGPVAGRHVRHALADRDHLDAQLVAQNPRIGEKRLVAAEGVDVGAAHAHAVHTDKGLPGAGVSGRRRVGQGQPAGFV